MRTELCRRLGIEAPIIQAGMGGASWPRGLTKAIPSQTDWMP
jgi:NAD(P)H-dependent flavin oxidoreductase YrpB (nitropropane dioxygenase family)